MAFIWASLRCMAMSATTSSAVNPISSLRHCSASFGPLSRSGA